MNYKKNKSKIKRNSEVKFEYVGSLVLHPAEKANSFDAYAKFLPLMKLIGVAYIFQYESKTNLNLLLK